MVVRMVIHSLFLQKLHDPAEALTRYIRAKMEFFRRQPQASRIFAMEVISGGPGSSPEHFRNPDPGEATLTLPAVPPQPTVVDSVPVAGR